ncbi:MAG: hypothetical protein QOI12_3674 [Alphaproteobacteria bacterium]|nr:hypothetical protein [Alphaproteobacteria bacterium]
MSSKRQNKASVATAEVFIREHEGEKAIFVDDSDFCTESNAADDEASLRRLYCRLENKKFIAWLKTKGCDRDAATPQMADEFDEMEVESIRQRRMNSAPSRPPIVECVDPARMDPDEWNAGADEWIHQGHDDLALIPLERPKWEELLRRRIERLEAEEARRAKARRQDLRRRVFNSLKPPKPSDIVLNGKSILDAENAYRKGLEELLAAWNLKYRELPHNVAKAWNVYHRETVYNCKDGEFRQTSVFLRARQPTANDCPADLMRIEKGLAHPAYKEFQRFNAALLQRLEQLETYLEHALNPPAGSRPPLKGWSLPEIDENEGSAWPVPGVLPHGLTFLFGSPKCGKSLWMQKLSACIAGGVPVDGIEGLEHGRVLYITRDIGASRQEVKKRLMKILPRLDLSGDALDGKLILTDDPFFLNDPTSVDNLLAHNPGRFVLVVIDSLFRCVIGSLTQDVVASAAVEAIDRISRATGAAMVAVHHEPRGGEHLFGSVMLDAAYDAKIHVERGKERNTVLVTVQELKNAPIPDKAFSYRLEEEYLAPVAGIEPGTGAVRATTAKPATSRHQEMLALLPTGWFTRKEGRKLIELLLIGSEEAKRKQWQRAVADMIATGHLEVRKTSLRKA